jgi:hypothetical protein
MTHPDLLEPLAEAVHQRWMDTMTARGHVSRKAPDGEELMVPYRQLSEAAKDLDRNSVRAVLDAAAALGWRLGRVPGRPVLDVPAGWAA